MPTYEDFYVVLFSLKMAFVATCLIMPCGVVLAAWLARSRSRLAIVVETLVSLPLVLPPTAIGFLVLRILKRESYMGRVLEALHIEILFTWRAVVIASAIMSFPLLIRSVRVGFENINTRLFQMARSLGHTSTSTWFRVALPLARRSIFAGALIAFTRALGEFGATILIAGNIRGETQTLALAIFEHEQTGNREKAMHLVLIAVVIAAMAIMVHAYLLRKRLFNK